MRSAWVGVSLIGLALAAAPARAGERAHLLANLNREVSQASFGGEPSGFFELGGRLLFSTADPGSLDQAILWSTDGTAPGTVQISTTLCPPSCHGVTPLGDWNGLEILAVATGFASDFATLFARTDGTPAGTFLLTDHFSSFDFRNPASLHLSPDGKGFFFTVCGYPCELWHSDGTRTGTAPFLGTDSRPFLDPRGFTVWRDRLYFVASRAAGDEPALWSTDGTDEGSRFVHAVKDFSYFMPDPVAAAPSHLFFTSGDAGEDLWVTDGSPEGSRRLADLAPPPCDPDCQLEGIPAIYAFGDEAYFTYQPPGHPFEIWRSDGSERGTRKLIELPADVDTIRNFERVGGHWFFTAEDENQGGDPAWWTVDDAFTRAAPLTGCGGGACPTLVRPVFRLASGALLFAGGFSLWATDGTGPGTRRLASTCLDFLISEEPQFFPGPRGRVYFPFCPNGGYGPGDLWVTDGTPAGTYRVGAPASGVGFLGGLAYFGGSPASGPGAELRVTDGRPGTGRTVTTLRRDRPGSDPQFLPSGNGVLIAATPRTGDAGLWTSDGTRSGTLPLFDFLPQGVPKFFGDFLGDLGSVQLMSVVHEDKGDYNETPELWRTDGTPQGTRLLKVFPAATYLDPQTAIVWNGRLLFVEVDAAGDGCSLWSTDGTPAGTRQIPWAQAACPSTMVPWGPQILFFVWEGGTGGSTTNIFAGDGTPAGTHPVATLQGFADSRGLAPIGGTLFFDLIAGEESQVWQTDGTGPGTHRASSLREVSGLQIFRGSLYFTAALSAEHEGGRGLFRIAPGGDPVPLARILHYSERTLYDPPSFAAADGRLLFLFEEIESDAELWATDGTPAGTRRVRWFEQLPNQPFSEPETMVSAGGRAFFAASDGIHGRELWQSDGTPEGTRMAVDLAPGGYSSIPAPSTFAVTKNYLFFAADDGKTGLEPWALPLEP